MLRLDIEYSRKSKRIAARYCQEILETLPFDAVMEMETDFFLGKSKELEELGHIYYDFIRRN